MSAITSNPTTVLVADDDVGHCELVRRNLRRAGLRNPIVAVHSGDAALEHVRVHASTGPLLVLLDINIPGAINGTDVLRQVKGAASTRKVPVMMLTSTDDPREMDRCYDLGCNVYVIKPVDPAQFVEAIRRIGQFIEILSVAPPAAELAA
jgi:CheY-like chemotaxis protein